MGHFPEPAVGPPPNSRRDRAAGEQGFNSKSFFVALTLEISFFPPGFGPGCGWDGTQLAQQPLHRQEFVLEQEVVRWVGSLCGAGF